MFMKNCLVSIYGQSVRHLESIPSWLCPVPLNPGLAAVYSSNIRTVATKAHLRYILDDRKHILVWYTIQIRISLCRLEYTWCLSIMIENRWPLLFVWCPSFILYTPSELGRCHRMLKFFLIGDIRLIDNWLGEFVFLSVRSMASWYYSVSLITCFSKILHRKMFYHAKRALIGI